VPGTDPDGTGNIGIIDTATNSFSSIDLTAQNAKFGTSMNYFCGISIQRK
jgi:hypothetical protein